MLRPLALVAALAAVPALAQTPTVTTQSASAISSTGARLNGSANPQGLAATGWFRYATTDPGTCSNFFGTRAPPSSSNDVLLGGGSSPISYFQDVTGLTPGTTYWFCALAQNAAGTGLGAPLTFTTP